MATDCKGPPKCRHCGKTGHLATDCWQKDPSKKPAAAAAKPKAAAAPKATSKAKGRGKGKSRGRGKLRELAEGAAEDFEGAEEDGGPEQEQEGDQVAMAIKAVKSASAAQAFNAKPPNQISR